MFRPARDVVAALVREAQTAMSSLRAAVELA